MAKKAPVVRYVRIQYFLNMVPSHEELVEKSAARAAIAETTEFLFEENATAVVTHRTHDATPEDIQRLR